MVKSDIVRAIKSRLLHQSAGLAGQNRNVMPGIVDRLFAAKGSRTFAGGDPVLANDDPVCMSGDFDRTPDRARLHRVFVVVEPDKAGLGHRRAHCMKPSKRPRSCASFCRSSSKT